VILASLSFGARQWLWPASALFAFGVVVLIFSYVRSSIPGPSRLVSFLLKALALGLLATCLLEPLWTSSRPREGANLFAIVADNSMGLQIHDRGETKSRGELLRENLNAAHSDWQEKLATIFQVRRYLFDSRLQGAKDFSDLHFDGRASAIQTSLAMLSERFQGQPLAGVLLFTDGNATDVADGALNLPHLPPIYPVLIGKTGVIRDLALGKVSVSQTAFEDAPVTILADALCTSFSTETVVAEVLSTSGTSNQTVVAHQELQPKKEQDQLSFRFQIKPEKPGLNFYKVRLSAKSSAPIASADTATEATLVNNERLISVDRGQGPYRILYISGRPNWEYKFLNRALAEDSQVQLVGLIRIARREPKFTFRGREGESSNPLFRGFQKNEEDTERYDQPVLIRLNTKDEFELRGGFPKLPEDLYGYRAIILDDLEAEFFTQDQMTLIQKFVSERGGGFLMLGGADSFGDGRYGRTPIADLLPVYLDRANPAKFPSDLRLNLTREGWLQTWARLRSTEQEEQSRLENLPGYQVMNPVRDVKPGASVIATVKDKKGASYPALVIQRFGAGRSACITLGDLWRGGLQDEKKQQDLAKMWRQIVRWLIADVPSQIDLQVEPKPNDPDQAVNFTVKARDKKFEPLDNATVQFTVSTPDPKAKPIAIPAEMSEKEPGLYTTTFVPRLPGAYKVSAKVVEGAGANVGESETGWSSDPLAEEFRSLSPNRAFLEEIARKTGGEMVDFVGIESFVSKLSSSKAPIMETYTYPLWDKSYVFAAAIGLLLAEWGLRRWKGLA
jgi:uncharacterized membrane protein